MNPLLKKEIRLVLPAWGLTLLLAVASPFLLKHEYDPDDILAGFAPAWFGIILLCASSFGREFSLGTFSSLMAQPCPRRLIWGFKAGVLAAALASILLGYFLSMVMVYHLIFIHPLGRLMIWPVTIWFGVLLLAAVAGGLWGALLLRQMVAIILVIALAPAGLCLPCLMVFAHFGTTDATAIKALAALLLAYSLAGIAGSWLILRRAQDVPWTGGIITIPDWMAARTKRRAAREVRPGTPWRALIGKEFHFNQVFLFGMAGLLLLNLGVVAVRYLRRNSYDDPNGLLPILGYTLWLFMPLVMGGASIAEERKSGTLEGQLCLPVPARRQFLVKLCFALVFGGVLSTLLPALVEGAVVALGLDHGGPDGRNIALAAAGMSAVALASFFASSLAGNVLQALPLALGLIVGIILVEIGLATYSGFDGRGPIPGFILWRPDLPVILLAVLAPPTLAWLAWRNFPHLPETAKMWRRNGLGLGGLLMATVAGSLLIYHRAWEKLTPYEAAHGTACWDRRQPPAALSNIRNDLLVALPDGRYWFGCLAGPPPEARSPVARFLGEALDWGRMPRLEKAAVIPGSAWVSATAGYADAWIETGENAQAANFRHDVASRETVAIRADGTLWVSETPMSPALNTAPLVQFGGDHDWKQVAGERSLSSVLLLKRNGTLWRWGDEHGSWTRLPPKWNGLRAEAPRQIGTNTDWAQLLATPGGEAQRRDGSVWRPATVRKGGELEMIPDDQLTLAGFAQPGLDDRKLAGGSAAINAGIRPDGTLWIWGDNLYWDEKRQNKFAVLQCSSDTNWAGVALSRLSMIGLRSDGTLWRWGGGAFRRQYADDYTSPPQRLGSHNDWVALMSTWNGVVSLAADGSLWLWPDGTDDDGEWRLVEPRQKPKALGSVLAGK